MRKLLILEAVVFFLAQLLQLAVPQESPLRLWTLVPSVSIVWVMLFTLFAYDTIRHEQRGFGNARTAVFLKYWKLFALVFAVFATVLWLFLISGFEWFVQMIF